MLGSYLHALFTRDNSVGQAFLFKILGVRKLMQAGSVTCSRGQI